MGLWPQFRSPLIWDVFAVSTYATVSLLFWFVGLIPDLATLRDRAQTRSAASSTACSPWAGADRRATGTATRRAYLLLAGLATPLVVSVHTVVSFDFAVGIIPGWHATIFPPYFVAGAIYSGFAMVLTLAIPLRAVYGLEDFITMRHLDNMAKVMLATGLIVAYGYASEIFMAWYSGEQVRGLHAAQPHDRPVRPAYWSLILCNVAVPQLLWFRRGADQRRGCCSSIAISSTSACGSSASSSSSRACTATSCRPRGACTTPTFWDWATFIGTIGLFLTLLLPVPPLPADDLDLRDAHDAARERGRGEVRRNSTTPSRFVTHDRTTLAPPTLRPAGGIRDPNALVAGRAPAYRGGYRHGRVHAVSRSRSCTRRSGTTARTCR